MTIMDSDDKNGIAAPLPGILQGEIEDLIDKYCGILSLSEVIGVLEIVKIGMYHRADDGDGDG